MKTTLDILVDGLAALCNQYGPPGIEDEPRDFL